jgi:hypothetical protein
MKGHTEINCKVQNKGWTKSGNEGRELVSNPRTAQTKKDECENHIRSNLDTIPLRVDLGKENKLTFLLDTGADLSVIERSSLQRGIKYSLKGRINIKGISNKIMKQKGP